LLVSREAWVVVRDASSFAPAQGLAVGCYNANARSMRIIVVNLPVWGSF
jgi:hypothetical protein